MRRVHMAHGPNPIQPGHFPIPKGQGITWSPRRFFVQGIAFPVVGFHHAFQTVGPWAVILGVEFDKVAQLHIEQHHILVSVGERRAGVDNLR